jgi:hypothetical protein
VRMKDGRVVDDGLTADVVASAASAN